MSDIAWTNITVTLGDLQPWQRNPRKSSKKQAQRMLESFDKFGQVQTIAVGPGLEVYDGHQRLSALLTVHGKAYEVDARQASRELSEQEREQLVITLHAGATGSWSWDSLANWNADSLQEWGFDNDALSQWNQDAASLSLMLESELAEDGEEKNFFDSSSLAGAPDAGFTKDTFLIYLTFQTSNDFKDALDILTFGDRSGNLGGQKFAQFDADVYLDRWKELISDGA